MKRITPEASFTRWVARPRGNRAQRGFLLIAAIVIIVAAGFMAVAIMTLTAGSGQAGSEQLSSAQALGVAESGSEHGQRLLAQNVDWYRNASDSAVANGACPPNTITRTIDQGTASICTNVPATLLRNRIPNNTSTAAIRVYTTDRYPVPPTCSPCYLQIDDDITAGEFVQYTGVTTNTFTGITRNRTISGVTGAPPAGGYARGTTVYPVTTLNTALTSTTCTTIPNPFRIVDHSKFLNAGTIDIRGEEISYSGSSRVGGFMTLSGVRRCQNGTAGVLAAAGSPVTPLLVDSSSPDYEAEVVSVGVKENAKRELRTTVRR